MMLDLKTTQYYLDCYGTDTSRWPEPDAGKTALAVYAKELGPDLIQAKRLDAAMSAAAVHPPSDLLARRIMANLPAQDGAAANDMRPARRFNWRAIAASFVILGTIGVTTFSLQSPPAVNGAAEAEVWREAALDMGVDDVFDWVYSEDG